MEHLRRQGRVAPGSSFGQEEGGQGLSSSQQNRVLSFLLWEAVAGGTVRAPWEVGAFTTLLLDA